MKVGVITQPNKKGQIVIPQSMRKALKIADNSVLNMVMRGSGIYIYPVDEVITSSEKENAYIKILSKTKGTWSDEKLDIKKDDKRKKKELAASKRRKQTW